MTLAGILEDGGQHGASLCGAGETCAAPPRKPTLREAAEELLRILREMPEVQGCTLYGSLAAGTEDAFSDIDITVDVSGCDNGQFMLALPERLGDRLPVWYSDTAPSLIPERYIVSVALDEEDPFRTADLCCCAVPHCRTVTREQATARNEKHTHILKLWTANLKHCRRGADCRGDVLRMAGKIGILTPEEKDNRAILAETLGWLECNADKRLRTYMGSCRRIFAEWEI